MGIIPFGILKQQNGSSSFQTPQIPAQKLVQQAQKMAHSPQQKPEIQLAEDIVKKHPELTIEGNRIIMKQYIKDSDVFHKLKGELEKKGWEYVAPKRIGEGKWEPGYFEFKDEGAKA